MKKRLKRLKPKEKRINKIGQPPGTLIFTGEKKKGKTKITIINYNQKEFEDLKVKELQDKHLDINPEKINWIKVSSLENVQIIEKIGNAFNLHPLLLEDIVSIDQRPKIEEYNNCSAIFLKILKWDAQNEIIEIEQATLILGENFVITFEESGGEIFKPIIERLKTSKGRVRQMNEDYLFYSLIDIIVDNYFLVTERFSDKIEELDIELIEEASNETQQKIQKYKREIMLLNRTIRPLREVINVISRGTIDFIHENILVYFRDIYDHIIYISETFENFRDVLSGMHEMYLSSVSYKMNEIINVLTIISSIFIPLSFLAGLYGMNFIFMPELQSPWGYPILLMVMASIAIFMVIYFRKRKWI